MVRELTVRDHRRDVVQPRIPPSGPKLATCKTMLYNPTVELFWSDEDAQYIRSRSSRYPGATDIEPEWTQETVDDEHCLELKPYPRSRVRATGYIGYSPSAKHVLVVIACTDLDGDVHGMNSWPASGRDLATYRRMVEDDETA